MAIVVVYEVKLVVINLRGKPIRILRKGGGGGGAKGSVGVMNNVSLSIHEIGDVFVAVVEIVGEHTGGWAENQRPGGDGFGGIPDVGVVKGVFGAPELLDAEVVAVDEMRSKDMVITVSSDCQ